MLQKIKLFWKKYKKIIKWVLILVVILIVVLSLYKILFYSTDESSVYGVRLNDIEENKISDEHLENLVKKSKTEGVSDVDIKVKGRLIKYFILYNEGVSKDDMKARINDMLGLLSDKIKGYYDVTFYVKQNSQDDEKYVMIGYKHKTKDYVTYDEF